MRTKILILGLACLIPLSCYMNHAQRIMYYPQTPNILYVQMRLTLEEMRFKITEESQKPTGWGDPFFVNGFLIGEKGQLKALVSFSLRQDAGNCY
jgi:hypothetical protein